MVRIPWPRFAVVDSAALMVHLLTWSGLGWWLAGDLRRLDRLDDRRQHLRFRLLALARPEMLDARLPELARMRRDIRNIQLRQHFDRRFAAAIGMAAATYMRSWSDAEYVPTLMLPLFLFSATFYPLSSYGDWQWVVYLSPLYHGVAVVRGLNLGEFEWSMLANLAVLLVLALVGLRITAHRINRRLLS